MKRQCIVELEVVREFHGWLEEKRDCREGGRVIGDSRTGKTFACAAYRLKFAPKEKTNGDGLVVPVIYWQATTETGQRELFVGLLEHMKYRVTRGTFLGRFCRANRFSHKVLGDELGIRVEWLQGWEVPSRRCTPTELQRLDLSKVVVICPKQIATMLSPEPLHLRTRLCAACYAETPAHQALWQSAKIETCDRHQLELLSTCPQCKTGFRIPALWEEGCCEHCS